MVTRDRLIIAIGYKCNYWKVLYFIATEGSWITKDGIAYLYKHSDQFACPLFMYKLFGYVKEADYHNKYRQSD